MMKTILFENKKCDGNLDNDGNDDVDDDEDDEDDLGRRGEQYLTGATVLSPSTFRSSFSSLQKLKQNFLRFLESLTTFRDPPSLVTFRLMINHVVNDDDDEDDDDDNYT